MAKGFGWKNESLIFRKLESQVNTSFLKVTIDRLGQKVYVSFYNLQVGFATNCYTTRSG